MLSVHRRHFSLAHSKGGGGKSAIFSRSSEREGGFVLLYPPSALLSSPRLNNVVQKIPFSWVGLPIASPHLLKE